MGFSYTKYSQALLILYRDCFVHAFKAFFRNWTAIIGSAILILTFSQVAPFFSVLGMAGDFLASLLAFLLLTIYYGWMAEAAEGRKLKLAELCSFDFSIFWSLMGVGFVLWIFSMLFLSPMVAAFPKEPIGLMASLVLFIFLNPIPELIYQHRVDGFGGVKTAISFSIENWIEWFLPFVLLLLPWLTQNSFSALKALAKANPLIPFGPILEACAVNLQLSGVPLSSFGLLLIGSILAHFFMLFRGRLYIELGRGSRRQRLFQLQTR